MPVYTEADFRSALEEALTRHGLTWDEFIAAGEADELVEISDDLDFAFRAIVPTLQHPTPAA